MKLKIVLAQLEPVPPSIEANVEKILNVVKQYQGDIYVFPELFLVGYHSKDALYRFAITIDHPLIDKLRMIAKDLRIGLVVGFPERTGNGYLYNAALAIDDKGNVFIYRKRHLPTFSVFDEHRWFKPSREQLKLWRFRGVGMGIGICYDLFFPEIFKAYTLMGAKLLITISAAPDTSVPLFHILTQARALENTCYLVWVNMVGFFDGLGYGGGSRAVDPLGNVVLQLKKYEEDVGVVEIDLDVIERYRYMRPVVRDSHIDDAEELLRAYKVFEGKV